MGAPCGLPCDESFEFESSSGNPCVLDTDILIQSSDFSKDFQVLALDPQPDYGPGPFEAKGDDSTNDVESDPCLLV